MACRVVRLIGLDAKVKADIGPLKSEVKGLEWANDGRLYIQLSSHILVASADGKTVGTVQDIQEDGTIIAMAISPSAAHLAASVHTPNDNQVHHFHLSSCGSGAHFNHAIMYLKPQQHAEVTCHGALLEIAFCTTGLMSRLGCVLNQRNPCPCRLTFTCCRRS